MCVHVSHTDQWRLRQCKWCMNCVCVRNTEMGQWRLRQCEWWMNCVLLCQSNGPMALAIVPMLDGLPQWTPKFNPVMVYWDSRPYVNSMAATTMEDEVQFLKGPLGQSCGSVKSAATVLNPDGNEVQLCGRPIGTVLECNCHCRNVEQSAIGTVLECNCHCRNVEQSAMLRLQWNTKCTPSSSS